MFTTENKSFVCLRGGRCCRELATKKLWLGGTISWEQKQSVLAAKEGYPKADKDRGGCEILVFEPDGKATCLARKLFGIDILASQCRDYPKVGESCVSGIENTGT